MENGDVETTILPSAPLDMEALRRDLVRLDKLVNSTWRFPKGDSKALKLADQERAAALAETRAIVARSLAAISGH